MSDRKNALRLELEQVRKRHGGKLKPSDVVAFARNPKTALHTKFEWDNSKAAQEYRLWQAREVIRVHVTLVPVDPGNIVVHPEFVSIGRDNEYLPIIEVLTEADKRLKLLRQTIQRLVSIHEVSLFTELSEVKAAISKVAKKYLAV